MPRDDRSYITVHDGLPEHPKVAPLSRSAKWGLIELWTYCSRNKTDGLVPASVAKQQGKHVLAALEQAGMLEARGEAWYCHDYLEHQRSRLEIEELKNKRRNAGSMGGRIRANNQASAQASAQAESKQSSSKVQADTETETDTNKRKDIAPAVRNEPAARQPDPLFDALVAATGINPKELTASQRGATNKALKELREVGADQVQIRVRADRFGRRYPDIRLTPTALAKHWPSLGAPEAKSTSGTNFGGGW